MQDLDDILSVNNRNDEIPIKLKGKFGNRKINKKNIDNKKINSRFRNIEEEVI